MPVAQNYPPSISYSTRHTCSINRFTGYAMIVDKGDITTKNNTFQLGEIRPKSPNSLPDLNSLSDFKMEELNESEKAALEYLAQIIVDIHLSKE